jgi:predicted phage terminase large subunit-like protein
MASDDLEKLEREIQQLEATLQVLMTEDEYAACEESLYAYYVAAWQFFDSAPFRSSWHLEAVCEHVQACLEGSIPDLIINIPPRCSKSSIISVASPTWWWGPRNMPGTKFLTMSYGQDLSTRDSVRSRRLIQSRWYRNKWKDKFNLAYDVNLKKRYENDKGGYRIASSVGGVGTGEGYDVLCCDDVIKADDADSDIALDNVIEWWKGTMATRANSPETSRRMIIMQRLSQKDLVAHIESKESDGWTILKLPMRYEPRIWVSPLGWKDPRTQEGELLCPSRFDEKAVTRLETQLGPYRAAAQLQQRPVPQGGGKVKEAWFKYFYTPAQHYDIIIQAWDLSFDDTENADYTVGGVWGRLGGDRFLLDVIRGQMDVIAQARAIANTYKKWPQSRAVLVENKANGPAVIKLLKNPEWIEILKVRVSGLTPVDPKAMGGDKTARLAKCVPEFAAGNVWFMHPDAVPLIEQVKTELTQFPKAAHDDCVDMVSYGLNWLAENGGVIYASAPSTQVVGQESELEKIENFQRRLVREEWQIRDSAREIRGYFD